MVPVSQLVLPVGVTGLTVNGKTPTPEPGSIAVKEVVRFRKRCEDTHKVMFGSDNTVQCHTQRMEFVQLASTWISLVLGVTAASQSRNTASPCAGKRSSAILTPKTSHILIGGTLTVELPDWPNCSHCWSRQAGKGAMLNPRRYKMSPLQDSPKTDC